MEDEPQGRIRQLGVADYDSLMDLWKRSDLQSVRPEGRDSRDALARQLAGGLVTIFGLEMDGALVGAILITNDGRKGWLNRLAVDPQCRRKGYGTRLVAVAEEALRGKGMRIFATLVESENRASLKLAKKLGYKEPDPGMHYLTKRDVGEV